MEVAGKIAFIVVFATGILFFILVMLRTIDGILDKVMKILGMERKE